MPFSFFSTHPVAFALACALVAVAYGIGLTVWLLRQPAGNERMQEIARAVQEGAAAYLRRQYTTIAVVSIVPFLLLGLYHKLGWGTAVGFLVGAALSAAAGFIGMNVAVRSNSRTAEAARNGLKPALNVAFRAGSVTGLLVVGLGLFGVAGYYWLLTAGFNDSPTRAIHALIGLAFGGSLISVFARLGGGIYTKAADVGADLVGKIEAGIPEDDPRNAAVIADNVGDNVGDCAGMAADVFESYEVTLVAAIILGAAAMLDPEFVAHYGGVAGAGAFALKLIVYPLLVRAIGVFASLVGTCAVRGKDEAIGDPMQPINIGFWTAAGISAVGFGLVSLVYLRDPVTGDLGWRFGLATLVGIGLAVVIGRLTELFTHPDRAAVSEIAYSAKTGPATLLLTGLGSGLESTVWSILAIAVTLFASYQIFGGSVALAAYGIALAGLGLLTTTGFILAEDTFGPIVDNANGIFDMSGVEHGESQAGRIVARLDQIGNTTKALTKGFAVAIAVVAAIALFRSC